MKKKTFITGLSFISVLSIGALIFFIIKDRSQNYVSDSIVPIDKNRVDGLTMPHPWKDVNEDYIVLETTNRYYVDLDRVYNLGDIETWMGTNDDNIIFTEFYNTIELKHLILERNAIDYGAVTDPSLKFKSISYSQLRTDLQAASPPVSISNNYDKLFKIDLSGTNVSVSSYGYKFEDAVFSVPLINAIVSNHGLTDPIIGFSQTKATSTQPAVTFFKVTGTTTAGVSFVGYYDYSQRPPIKKYGDLKYIF